MKDYEIVIAFLGAVEDRTGQKLENMRELASELYLYSSEGTVSSRVCSECGAVQDKS